MEIFSKAITDIKFVVGRMDTFNLLQLAWFAVVLLSIIGVGMMLLFSLNPFIGWPVFICQIIAGAVSGGWVFDIGPRSFEDNPQLCKHLWKADEGYYRGDREPQNMTCKRCHTKITSDVLMEEIIFGEGHDLSRTGS